MTLKQITLTVMFFILTCISVFAGKEDVYLVLDAPRPEVSDLNVTVTNCPRDNTLPRNWRTSMDPFKNTGDNPLPVRNGLDGLNISGSGSFSIGQFAKMRETIGNKKVIVVDLREESHCLVNNMAVSWYNVDNNLNFGKRPEDILILEKELLNKLMEDKEIKVTCVFKKKDITDMSTWDILNFPVHVETVITEEELVTKYGYGYYRIFVTDGNRPTDEEVDDFINFYKKLSHNTWLHFHCKAGKGRTTTFMVMYDMMYNYDKASRDDIVRRQFLIGGIDLTHTTDEIYKTEKPQERMEFVKKFYEYCRQNGPDYKILWSEWIK
jgi:protein tyrosine phosphatase